MLERSLSRTFRDFSTYFLLMAAFVAPLELGYHYVFRDVVQVRSVFEEIEQLPEGQSMGDVDKNRLDLARWVRTGVNFLQLLLIPFLVPAAIRIADVSDRGEVPRLGNRAQKPGPAGSPLEGLRAPAPILVAGAIAVVVGVLVHNLGNLVTNPLDFAAAWAIVGLNGTVARSVALPFVVVTWAEVARSGARRREGEGTRAVRLD